MAPASETALAAAVTVVLAAGAAAAAGAAEPEVLPGPWAVRGRPVVLRVPGATRVRAADGPWAAPVGPRGDEFVLQARGGAEALRSIDVSDDAGTRRAAITLREADPPVRLSFGTAGSGALSCAASLLPTVREGWLLADVVEGDPASPAPDAAAALAAWRSGPRAATDRAAFEPLLHAPSPRPFRAMADLAAAAPRLPGPVRDAALVAAAAAVALALATRRRRAPVRAAWIATPGVACAAWMLASSSLPGAVRAVAFQADGEHDTLVVLHLSSETGGSVAFDVPPDASHPAILSFDAEDASAREDVCGRRVEVSLAPGGSRIVAWRMPPEGGESAGPEGGDATGRVPGEVRNWLSGLGLDATATTPPRPPGLSRRAGFSPVSAPGVRVRTRK